MNILCSNPKIQFEELQQEIHQNINNVYESGIFINGKQTDSLEEEFSSFNSSKYTIAVSSGTSAIEIVLRALDITNKSEVITVSHTAIPTVSAIELANHRPHLVDIDINTYTLNPKSLKQAINEQTKAVVLVHLYGQPAYVDEIIEICNAHNLILIEDCSQAHGATWNNIKVGNFGVAGCFSCYPTKNLGALGDAGLITTNNEKLYEKIKLIKQYGWKQNGVSLIKGGNYRIDEIQSAVLRVKLKHLDRMNAQRKKIASEYSRLLSSCFVRPIELKNASHVYHLYVIRTRKRDWYMEKLKDEGIYAGIHYKLPVHKSPAYKSITKELLPNTDLICDEILSLPMYPGLTKQEVEFICRVINSLNPADQ